MFSPGHSGANAYARVGVETGVMGASPHRLTNIKQSEAMLIEVDRLLATLEEAWIGIAPEIARMAAQPAAESMR
ncbi:hypothetical protein [Paraburkholderia phytofirmans]|uniref:hypothetical protein n=1 Tax=Paraburkholderia phytofirmans TaxID=261302 RepID=UPI0007B606F1|nr:hypothetical protein [Paraburkholderia phytofirmans]